MSRASDASMPSKIRHAVSVVLHRNGTSSVYLVRRNPKLRFFGGYWAFPGGGLHAVDEELRSRLDDTDSELASYRVAAARECFEELGISLVRPELPAAERAALLEDARHFASIVSPSMRIEGELLRPWLRLLTPPFSAIRFDTAFFGLDVDVTPSLGEPRIVQGELVEGAWAEPAQWLDRWRSGELLIAPPVLLILKILAANQGAAALAELRELERDFAAGEIHPILNNPAAQLMPLLTPTLPPATHTNAYLVGQDPAYLVDPATPHADEQQRLVRAVERARADDRHPRAILLTHHHPDHVGAVEFARRHWNLPVCSHAITADLLRGAITVDRTLEDGEKLPLGKSPDGRPAWELECLFTPGHAAGHLCFFERRYGSLLCGDMMSTLSSILVHPDDGDMRIYMESLRRLAALEDLRMIYPAHGPAAAGSAMAAQIAHREAREQAIAAALDAGARSLKAIVERVYVDVPSQMHDYAALSVRSVLRKLEAEGDRRASRIVT